MTLGEFKRLTYGLPNDFEIDLNIRKFNPESYGWDGFGREAVQIEFDDIGHSDKVIKLSAEVKEL